MRVSLITDFGSCSAMRDMLFERGFMSAPELERERAALLSVAFAKLTGAEKRQVLKRIRASVIKRESLERHYSADLAGQALKYRVEATRRRDLKERLEPIATQLDGYWAKLYQALSAEFPPTPNGFDDEGIWEGPESPCSPEELSRLSTSELFDYIESWRPDSSKVFAPSPAGLARVVSPIVEARRVEVLAMVDRVLAWPSIYVLGVIETLRKHVSDEGFDIAAFVRLLGYVRKKSDGYGSEESFDGSDLIREEAAEAWSSLGAVTAFAITDLLRRAVLDRAFRQQIWEIIEGLLSYIDPTPEDDTAQYLSTPWNAALNSTRGAGLLTAFDYGRWLYRTEPTDDSTRDLMDIAPESDCCTRPTFG